MKFQNIVYIVILVIIPFRFIQPQEINSNKNFEIVYLADGKYASNPVWLKKMRDDWKATGINLRIFRSGVESFDGKLNWNNHPYQVDDALTQIADVGLNIYLRINLALLDIQAVNKTYTDEDYHIRSNGKRFLNQYDALKRPLLNLTSTKSRSDMLNFVKEVVKHINTLPNNIRSKIKLIVPTISTEDETELPFNTYDDSTKSFMSNVLSGYSKPEIAAFMKFLADRYKTIDSLNDSWGEDARFSEFNSNKIQIRNYNWDGIKTDPKARDYYVYENGRKDFIDFRRAELKRFIDDCSAIVRDGGFNFGVQFGSIYDATIEFRGFYDPTSFVENVDEIITDDILEYYPNFSFSADYSRSLCKYWNWENKNKTNPKFATEVNWPGYNDHRPEELIKYWSMQLRIFYKKGASCLFVSNWGVIGGPNNVGEKIISGNLLSDYNSWQDTLKKYRNVPIKNVNINSAFNLSCELALNSGSNSNANTSGLSDFSYNNGISVGTIDGKNIVEFPLYIFSKLKGENTGDIVYQNEGDFITNYMLRDSPEYLQENYKNFYFTGTSRFMPKSIAVKFK